MRYKSTLIVAVLFFLLLGYVLLFEDDRIDEDRVPVFTLASEEIALLELLGPETTIRLEKTDGTWEMVEPHPFRVDQKKIEEIAATFSTLSSERVIYDPEDEEHDDRDLHSFGIDSPEIEVRVALNDGREKSLIVGDQTPIRGAHYVKRADGDKIYRVSSTIIRRFTQGVSDLRDYQVIAGDLAHVQQIVFKQEDENVEKLSLYRDENQGWILDSPYHYPLQPASVQNLIGRLDRIMAKEFIDDPDELAPYGLDDPQTKISLEMAGVSEPSVYLVGSREEDHFYMHREGGETVYVVPPEHLGTFNQRLVELMNRRLFEFGTPDTVDSAEIIMGETTYEYNRTQNEEQLEDLLQRIRFIRVTDLVGSRQEIDAELDDPQLSIAVHLKDGETQQVDIFRRDGEIGHPYHYLIPNRTPFNLAEYDTLVFDFASSRVEDILDFIREREVENGDS